MEVYAIPNYECSLACQHCEIKDMKCKWDKAKFIKQLEDLPTNAHVTLFGGEPTLFADRLEACWKTGRVNSISTNLLHLSYEAWGVLLGKGIDIATSWNLFRFNDVQYARWLENLRALAAMRRSAQVMVTLTEDLIAESNWSKVLDTFDQIDQTKGCNKLLLEHLISDDAAEDLHKRCDEWMCKLHDAWRWNMSNQLEEKLKTGWTFRCDDVWTLHPDGQLQKGCPHGKKTQLCKECLSCSKKDICKPCKLQCRCTFPKKLYEKLTNETR